MHTILALLLILLAGMLNGSFALPTKYITKWGFEHIWLNFSLWGFVILPCLTMSYLAPKIFQIYTQIPINLLLIIMIGGLFYGVGQICFACALDIIGIGLGFAINLGIGIILGFAIPLVIQHPHKIFTQFGLVILIGAILAVIALIISNHAGVLRDRHKLKIPFLETTNKKNNSLGVIFAIIAGLSSASQNFVFSYTHSIQDLAEQAGASSFAAANILWPGYLLCGFVPYILYMFYLHYKNQSFGVYRQQGISKYYLFTFIMGVFAYGSLCFYAKGSQLIGALGPVIGWPLFMGVVILLQIFGGGNMMSGKIVVKKQKTP
jgi:L-rhamnose-H+ transport protein